MIKEIEDIKNQNGNIITRISLIISDVIYTEDFNINEENIALIEAAKTILKKKKVLSEFNLLLEKQAMKFLDEYKDYEISFNQKNDSDDNNYITHIDKVINDEESNKSGISIIDNNGNYHLLSVPFKQNSHITTIVEESLKALIRQESVLKLDQIISNDENNFIDKYSNKFIKRNDYNHKINVKENKNRYKVKVINKKQDEFNQKIKTAIEISCNIVQAQMAGFSLAYMDHLKINNYEGIITNGCIWAVALGLIFSKTNYNMEDVTTAIIKKLGLEKVKEKEYDFNFDKDAIESVGHKI